MIESAIKSALESMSGMEVYPLLLPDTVQEGVTFQRISDPEVDNGMVRTGLIAGRFQIAFYRVEDYTALVMLDKHIWANWKTLRHGDISGFPVQYVERGGIIQDKVTLPNNSAQYRLVRDFTFYFHEGGT